MQMHRMQMHRIQMQKIENKYIQQAGAELCQAQVKLGLANPTVASNPPLLNS